MTLMIIEQSIIQQQLSSHRAYKHAAIRTLGQTATKHLKKDPKREPKSLKMCFKTDPDFLKST